jgi:hypothetical protein
LPIVLCDLEGRSRKEVAQQLAIPEGTLSSRLATARKKLSARLTRLGFAVSSVSLAALLTESTATAGIVPSLFTTTTKAALLVAAGSAAVAGVASATVSALTEGVLKTMFIAKIKTTALVLCSVVVLGVGTGGVYYQTRAGAADSPQDSQSDQRPTRKAVRGQDRSTDDWRRIAEDLRRQLDAEREKAKLTEQELRSLAAKLRDETTLLRERIEMMMQQAEVREKQAHEALVRQQRSQNEAVVRDKLEATRDHLQRQYQERLEALAVDSKKVDEQQIHLQTLRKKLDAEAISLKKDFLKRSQELEEMKKRIAQEQAGQTPNQPKPEAGQTRSDGDKLDQILKRLERLENRLDRVEKSRQ